MQKYFQFKELNTNYKKEFVAGLTTFLAMAYIIFVNPSVLSQAGMDKGAVFTATCLAAAFGTLFMGVVAKYPIALAPGMGLNAFFTYSVVLTMGIPWQTALSGVLMSGIIFIIITIFKIRETIINAIPQELKYAVACGIGLFIAFIGLKNAGIVVSNKATFVSVGDFTKGTTLLAIFGFIVTILMMIRNIRGSIFYGMVITAIVGIIFGLIDMPTKIIGSVPSLAPTFGDAFKHFGDIFSMKKMWAVVLTFFFVDFFDTAGTIIAVATKAGLMKDNKLPRAGRALLADSSAIVVGAILGTSSTTAYVESTSGVAAGGRTGFTSVVTAIFLLLSLFFSPLLVVVTPSVTAPALIVVGVLMVSVLGKIDWNRLEIAVPAFLTIVAMPLTYSIANGVALGFLLYPITMLVKGRAKEIHPIMYLLLIIFLGYFIFLI